MTHVTPSLHTYKPSRKLVLWLIGAFVLLFVSGVTYIAWSLRATVDDAEDFLSSGTDALPLFIKETGPINNDPQKAAYLGRAEISIMQAELFAMKNNYLAAHNAFLEANESLAVAFDGNSVFLNVFLIREATFEETFKKWPESEALLRKALAGLQKSSPNLATLMSATNMLGNVLEKQRKFPEAIVQYKKAVQLASQFDAVSKSKKKRSACVWARQWLASCYWDAHQYTDVVATREEIDKMLQENGSKVDRVNNLLSLGSARARAGNDAAALKDYDAAIVIDPENTEALRFKADIFSSLKRFPEALNCLSRAIELDPKDVGCWEERAGIYSHTKKFELAISDLHHAISLKDYPVDHIDLASAMSWLGRDKEAIAEYTSVLNKDDSQIWAYIYRGAVYQKLKQYDLAVSDYTTALKSDEVMKEEDPDATDAESESPQLVGASVYKRRSACYQALGQREKSAQDERYGQDFTHESKQNSPAYVKR